MRKKFVLKVLAISIALVIVTSGMAMYSSTDVEKGISEGDGNGVISLVAPSFISTARATGGGGGGAGGGGSAFPEGEAGISAYVNTSQTIDLDKLKTIFLEVEEVGDNYIIGITNISDFGGNINVTVYADTSGWIVAYFKKHEPAAMVMQWGKDTDVNNPVITTITTTTLRDAVYKAAIAAGIPPATLPEIKYYDFEFPDANGMTLFIRTRATDGANIAQVEIPATYTLYEASYYHYIYYKCSRYTGYSGYWDSKLKVDGTIVSDAVTSFTGYSDCRWWRAFDSYGPYITTGTLHKIEISYEKVGSWQPQDTEIGSSGVATVLIYNTA